MNELRMGFAAAEIPVPLFTELHGYAPGRGRRSRGVRDALTCRALSLGVGDDRVLVIASDVKSVGTDAAWRVRTEVCRALRMPGSAIALTATGTASAPNLAREVCMGEVRREFVDGWVRVAVATACDAAAAAESVTVHAGVVPCPAGLAVSRLNPLEEVRPEIRWVLFRGCDGGNRVLVHNCGIDACVFGKDLLGRESMRRASADWPGEVSRLLTTGGGAVENVLFLQGGCGDVVPARRDLVDEEAGGPALAAFGHAYAEALISGFAEELPVRSGPVRYDLRRLKLPVTEPDPAAYRDLAVQSHERAVAFHEADKTRNEPAIALLSYHEKRLEEMALHLENGGVFESETDLQVLSVGGLKVLLMPGAPYSAVASMAAAAVDTGDAVLVAGLANDNIGPVPPEPVFAAAGGPLAGRAEVAYMDVYTEALARFRPWFRADVGDVLTNRSVDLMAGLA